MAKIRFSSMDFPETERETAFQEVYAALANEQIAPYKNHPSNVNLVGQLLPNLSIYEFNTTPHESQRTRKHVAAETRDELILLVPVNGSAVMNPEKADALFLNPGDAILVSSDSVRRANTYKTMSFTAISVPRTQIEPRISNLGGRLMQKVANASTPELRLLMGYSKILAQMDDDLSPELAILASTQVNDLFALMLGAKREEAEIANKRSLRAVRLKAIKQDILTNITDSRLSITQVALRQGLSPQYIRALFNGEQTTFADYVNELRLQQIYRQLSNPLFTNCSISTLAYDMGFNSLSWFNRAFKQRFGIKPTDVREKYSHSQDKKHDNFNNSW